jgi:hypothetical protein
MVDINIGAVPPVQNNQSKGQDSRRQNPKKKLTKDRRKNKQDRRNSVRSGVKVTLSEAGEKFVGYKERRKQPDRRKSNP